MCLQMISIQLLNLKAHNARSEKEMHNIVADRAGGIIQ